MIKFKEWSSVTFHGWRAYGVPKSFVIPENDKFIVMDRYDDEVLLVDINDKTTESDVMDIFKSLV